MDSRLVARPSRWYRIARQSYRPTLRVRLLAVPTVTIVENEMRRIAGPGSHAHEVFHAGSSADNLPGIEHFNDWRHRKQVELRWSLSREFVGASKLRLAWKLRH